MRSRNIYNEERGPWDHSTSDRYSSPYPGTAIGPGEERYQRNEEFSERLKKRREGGHYGKGPVGWKRADSQIKEDICEALYVSPSVDASEIEVEVEQGIVTLNGSVFDRAMKKQAERCLDSIKGIDDIQNCLNLRGSK